MIKKGEFFIEENLFQRFCNFDAFYDSSYSICRNVRWKDSTVNFEENRLNNILALKEQLENDSYEQLVFNSFTIIERGKPRDIRACHIYDRLAQNTLCSQVLIPELTPKFIYDNCATLKGKGIDFALLEVRKHLQAAHRTYGLGKPFYGLRIDIQKFFDSIDHNSLKQMAKHYIKEERVFKLIDYIIDTFCFSATKDTVPIPNKQYYIIKKQKYKMIYPKQFYKNCIYYEFNHKSLGLGSQASQLLALLALNGIDHYAKEHLHLKYYGRYMDDIYILHNDKEYLKECLNKIENELNKIHLKCNKRKTKIIKISPIKLDKNNYPHKRHPDKHNPFKYLKWDFYLTNTNKIIQTPFKKKIKRQYKKMRKMHQLWLQGKITDIEIQESYRGFREHINKGTTFYIIQNLDNYFHSLFKGVEIL